MAVVFLHGGPGRRAAPLHRRLFDPAHFRIVIFDQRNAGRSKPLGESRCIPAFIVQGRYGPVCPIRSTDDLTRLWPEACYQIIARAGHAESEPGIRVALLDCMDRFCELGWGRRPALPS